MSNDKLRKKLKKLFDTQVVVRKVGKDRVKVIDTSRLQSTGGNRHSRYGGSFTGMHTSRTRGLNPHNQTLNFHSSKLMLFTDYEAMDTDPIIASALDIYSDESTVSFPDGDLLKIHSEDANIKKILRNLFYDILNIDYNLWSWIRNMCKYGDFYLYLDIEKGIGVKNVRPLSSYDMRRVEGEYQDNPYEVYFNYEGDMVIGNNSKNTTKSTRLENFEVAHFRLLTDTNFLPYGRSQIEPARKIFKMLVLMEDAMLIYRITRSPERRLFKVDVGNIPPEEVDNYMEKIINESKKVPYVNQKTGDYNLKYNVENQMEDYYLPVRGKESGTDISVLPGLSNDGYMDDIEYVREKMMSALKIPKAWLGYDKGVEGKCISPDTKIPLISGEVKTVSDLIVDFENGVKNYVYSLNEDTGNIVPGEIEWAGYTRMNTEVVRVWLDNNKYIDCTPDHRFLLRDGTWIEAQHLKPEDSLMPLYFKDGGYKGHYTKVYHPSSKKYQLVHRLVADYYGIKEDNKVIHHIDFNSRNNNPENLDGSMTFYEHRQFHVKNAHLNHKNPNMIAYRNSKEFLENCSKAGKKGGKISGPMLGRWVKENGPANKKEDLFFGCVICGKRFKIHHYRKNTVKHCGSDRCKSEYYKQHFQYKNQPWQKYHKIDFAYVVDIAKNSRSFKNIFETLKVDRKTFYKCIEYNGYTKEDFIQEFMPLSKENVYFTNNYKNLEYKNHKVYKVEVLPNKIDTCDLTISKYHNFGTDAGVIIHNSVLAAEDIRFARTIERLQNIVLGELKKIAIVHLYTQGYTDEDLINFRLELNSPSIVYKRQQVDLMTEQINLANSMIDTNLFSRKYIYEHIFDMSESEWMSEQDMVVKDLEDRFRQAQIETEGNDPKVSGMSFGTPHDLMSMQLASKESSDQNGFNPFEPPSEGEEMRGRPKRMGTIGTHDDLSGRDPLGDKDMKQNSGRVDDEPLDHKFKDGGPMSTKEGYSSLVKQLRVEFDNKKHIISEIYQKTKNNRKLVHPLLDEDIVIKDINI